MKDGANSDVNVVRSVACNRKVTDVRNTLPYSLHAMQFIHHHMINNSIGCGKICLTITTCNLQDCVFLVYLEWLVLTHDASWWLNIQCGRPKRKRLVHCGLAKGPWRKQGEVKGQ